MELNILHFQFIFARRRSVVELWASRLRLSYLYQLSVSRAYLASVDGLSGGVVRAYGLVGTATTPTVCSRRQATRAVPLPCSKPSLRCSCRRIPGTSVSPVRGKPGVGYRNDRSDDGRGQVLPDPGGDHAILDEALLSSL